MKKNDWILVAITGIYSFLFYGEYLGINLSIFTILIIIGMMIKNKEVLQQNNWKLVALSCIISAISVSYLGNNLSILANFISLLILIGMNMNKKASVFFSLIYGVYSLLLSPKFLYEKLTDKKNESVDIGKIKRKSLLVIIPILITLIFFFMYKNSNSIFSSFADKINFDWISWGWIFFSVTGLLYLFGVFNSKKIKSIALKDEVDNVNIENENWGELQLFGKTFLIIDEYFSAKLLFILLNILIASVNLIDFNFLLFNQKLPDNLTFAQFLHQGVGMLVVSIAISIFIILFYFRGELNFYSKSKFLKSLAYLWIIQNIFMLISVCVKNTMYTELYGLTYKRLGIYTYILLSLIGLITTLLKVYKVKANIYLIRLNGWTFFAVLVFTSIINWDKIIIKYDQVGNKNYDLHYLLSISNSNLDLLIDFEKHNDDLTEKKIIKDHLAYHIGEFKQYEQLKSWKSWNYQDEKVSKAIEKYEKDKLTASH